MVDIIANKATNKARPLFLSFSRLLAADKQKFLKRFIIPIERVKLIGGYYDIISYKDHEKGLVVKISAVYI